MAARTSVDQVNTRPPSFVNKQQHVRVSHDERVSTHRHTKQQLDRITERDGIVKAWVHRHEDEAILGALATAPPGPLSGWTLGVKDVIDTLHTI